MSAAHRLEIHQRMAALYADQGLDRLAEREQQLVTELTAEAGAAGEHEAEAG